MRIEGTKGKALFPSRSDKGKTLPILNEIAYCVKSLLKDTRCIGDLILRTQTSPLITKTRIDNVTVKEFKF